MFWDLTHLNFGVEISDSGSGPPSFLILVPRRNKTFSTLLEIGTRTGACEVATLSLLYSSIMSTEI